MSEKLTIASEMRAFDTKDRDFYRELSDEDRKKFSNYLMIRWGSCVSGSVELQEYYILSTHVHLNKNFFAISKHPELQWLSATTVSPGIGVYRHQWITPKKRGGGNSKAEKFLTKIYPNYKLDDISTLAELTDISELRAMAEGMGWTKEQIKKEL